MLLSMLSPQCSLFSSASLRGLFNACSCAASQRDSYEQMLKMTEGLRVNEIELAHMDRLLDNPDSRALYRVPKETIEDNQIVYD